MCVIVWLAVLFHPRMAHGTPLDVAAGEQSSPPAGVQAQATDSEFGIPEIVVTANKRDENLDKVGLTITAIDAQTLAVRHVDTLADLANVVPGLAYTESSQNTPIFTLRGVGFYDTSLASYPTTSVYLDEVPLPFPVMTTLTAFDLERVEVLKGPQGTLFGNNATGGAINFIAAKPTSSPTAGTEISYSRFNTTTVDGFVSGPLADDLLGRASFKASIGDGWQESYTRDATNGRTDNYAGRILLDWNPTSTLRLELNLNGWQDKNQTQAPQFATSNPQFPAFGQFTDNFPVAPLNDRSADWSPEYPLRRNNTFYQVAVRGDQKLTDAVTLTSITSYIRYQQSQNVDDDGTDEVISVIAPAAGNITSVSQELRLANGAAEPFRWIVGANYSSDDVLEIDDVQFADASPAKAGLGSELSIRSEQDMKNYAGFANGELDVLPDVTIKAGVRYTAADRAGNICSSADSPGGLNSFFTGLSGLLTGAAVPPVIPGQCFPLNADFLPSRTPTPLKLDENNVSWRTGVDWRVAANTLLYVDFSKGYKAGGFPTLSASSTKQYAEVKQESVLDYEGGFKIELLNRRLSLNAAAFYYSYDDKQVETKEIDPVFGPLDVLANIPKSSVKGLEFETTARLTRGLTVRLSTLYTDATIDQYQGVNFAGQIADFDGARMPFSPVWRGALGGDYEWALAGNLAALVGADYNYQSRSVTTIGGTGLYTIAPYGLLDLRAGVKSSTQNWSLTVWGKNVTDKYYTTNTNQFNDTTVRYAGRPADFGITIAKTF